MRKSERVCVGEKRERERVRERVRERCSFVQLNVETNIKEYCIVTSSGHQILDVVPISAFGLLPFPTPFIGL